ncbi:hypothetical protein OAA09_01175 [bacterium]|nr:hypothetical protein [bacterium]
MNYSPGDIVQYENSDTHGIVIRKVPFKEVCDRADDGLLEYDIDEMFEAYQKGGCYEILVNEKLEWFWSNAGLWNRQIGHK